MKRLHGLSVLLLTLLFIGAGCAASGIARTERFAYPDIKDEFCGVHINFQYCKCAFHGDYCDAVGMSRGDARAHVQQAYNAWAAGLLKAFGESCAASGGAFDGEECYACKETYVAQGAECVPEEDMVGAIDVIGGDAVSDDGPLNADCTLRADAFDAEWRNYSDIDDRIPYEERSWEAKNAVDAYDQMIEAMVLAFQIERDIEIERQTQEELRVYKDALVRDLKTNLLKSFWRLAWVTYSTIDSSRGLGQSYATLVTEGASIETLGAGLKVIQGVIPSDSSLAIDTSTVTGKAKSVGAAAALELVDSLGDPVKVATEFTKGAAMAPLPSADITEEEIAILKRQHLDNGAVDAALKDGEATIASMEALLAEMEVDIARFREEIDAWEAQEKERVGRMLEESCKERRGR